MAIGKLLQNGSLPIGHCPAARRLAESQLREAKTIQASDIETRDDQRQTATGVKPHHSRVHYLR